MKPFPSILLALALTACATVPAGRRVAAADAPILRLQRGYQTARAIVALFAPYLPPGDAARLAMLGLVVERALLAAGAATDPATRAATLDRATAATAAYRHAAGQ